MRTNRSLAIVLCVVLACMCVGCGQADSNGKTQTNVNSSQTEVDPNQSRLNMLEPSAYGNVQGLTLEAGGAISVIGRGKSSAYWKEVQKGAQAAIDDINERMGYKGDDKVKLVYSAPETTNDVDDQVNILDEELARYPLAVGIAAVDSSACEVQFDLATENDIPIVAFDSGTSYQGIVSMVDTNNIEASHKAAANLCDSIDEAGEVAVFVHDSKSTSAKEREQGFVDEIKEKNPDVSVVSVYHLDDLETMQKEMEALKTGESQAPDAGQTPAADADTSSTTDGTDTTTGEKAADTASTESEITQSDVIEYILSKYPELKGCYTTNEATAELVVEACENLELEDMKIVSFDGGEDQLERLKEGKLSGLVVQNPYGIGYATVVACARAVLGQGNEAVVDAGYTWVTKDNLEDSAIQKMMY